MITHKTCLTCQKTQEIANFAKQSSNADKTGYKSYCRECYKGMRRKYYVNNHKAAIDRSVRTSKRLRREFQELKSKLECIKCGQKDPRCLQFHHRDPKQKTKEVAKLWHINGKKAAGDEMKKCDVLCANCHRKEHFKLDVTLEEVGQEYPMIGEKI